MTWVNMKRPTRTRRLSIAAITSLLAFMALASAGVRSFWTWDGWVFPGEAELTGIMLHRGSIFCVHPTGETLQGGFRHVSGPVQTDPGLPGSILGFFVSNDLDHGADGIRTFALQMPLWLPLLLLLVAPVLWLVARPANAPAFPFITDAKQSK